MIELLFNIWTLSRLQIIESFNDDLLIIRTHLKNEKKVKVYRYAIALLPTWTTFSTTARGLSARVSLN